MPVSPAVLVQAAACIQRSSRNLDTLGMYAQDTSELFFDDVRVPKENLLGASEGQGFSQLMVELNWDVILTDGSRADTSRLRTR